MKKLSVVVRTIKYGALFASVIILVQFVAIVLIPTFAFWGAK